MYSRLLAFLLLSLIALGLAACDREVTSEDWQADLRTMHQELADRHPDLHHAVPESVLNAAVDDLHARIPTLTDPEILVGMARIVAMVGDGHTALYPSDQERWRFRYYPLRLYAFADGIYLTATTDQHSELFGKQLVRIDQTQINRAYELIATTIGADNEMEHEYTVPFELTRAELLHVLEIADSPDSVRFVFEDGTQTILYPYTAKEWLDLDWLVVNETYAPTRKSPSMRHEFLFATPFTLPHLQERKYYWYEYIEDRRTMFLQYNTCWDQKDEAPFADVVADMFELVDSQPVERLVIDLRQNSGGEPLVAEPLIRALEERKEIGDQGRLFVLTGRRTFSAALTNAAHLRSRAGARVVGEPPRGKPNHPSEGRDIDLGRTGAWLTVSTEFVERDSTVGDSDYLPVDIEATYRFDAYRRGTDPVLEAALTAPLRP